MTIDIRKNIIDKYDGISFDLSDWQKVLDESCDIFIAHQKSTVSYFTSYFKGENLSFILYENNRPVGIFPIFIYRKNSSWSLGSHGADNLIPPLFVDDLARKTKKRLEKTIVDIILTISKLLRVRTVKLSDHGLVLSSWYMLWLEKASRSFLVYQLVIDLSLSINNIRLGFRKSYKPLVNKALKEWDISVHEGNIGEIFEEFRLLHLHVSGKETRTSQTWDIQKTQIENYEAFLVTARNNGVLIGAGLFNYTKNVGNYSVGAYERELFDRPIGHGIQMKAIETLKEKGCRIYYLGQKMTLLDENKPTNKEMSISHFKEGFSEYVLAQPYLEISL